MEEDTQNHEIETPSRNKSPRPVSEDGERESSPEGSKDRRASHTGAEDAPPLPEGPPPEADDGWEPLWDENANAYYFYNRYTQTSQWTNPRVPDVTTSNIGLGNHERIPTHAPGTDPPTEINQVLETPIPPPSLPIGGYNPAIHGDFDPNADYARPYGSGDALLAQDGDTNATTDPNTIYAATGTFNRFTGKWQPHSINPDNHNDEAKSNRQMNAFFDVDAAANSHNGKSLKAERSSKKLSKQELKAFKEKRKERKEEKRRAWLRD